jgi:hypothetical protein
MASMTHKRGTPFTYDFSTINVNPTQLVINNAIVTIAVELSFLDDDDDD